MTIQVGYLSKMKAVMKKIKITKEENIMSKSKIIGGGGVQKAYCKPHTLPPRQTYENFFNFRLSSMALNGSL
jgi:hypothetical protein